MVHYENACELRNRGRWRRVRHFERFDPKDQAVNRGDDDRLADRNIGGRNCIPDLAMHEYFAAWRQISLCDRRFSNQSLRSGDKFIAVSLESDSHKKRGDRAQGDADAQRR
jgi:hypothetical protein